MTSNIFRKEFNFLKDSLLIVSFVKTGEVTERVRDQSLSLKFIFFNILIFSMLRVVLEIIHWKRVAFVEYGAEQNWDFVNLMGFTWQVGVFLLFVLPFSSYVLFGLSSSSSTEKTQFIKLFNVYFYLSLLFALSPIFDIIAIYLGVPSYFKLPFGSVSIITMGQLIEAFIIPVLS